MLCEAYPDFCNSIKSNHSEYWNIYPLVRKISPLSDFIILISPFLLDILCGSDAYNFTILQCQYPFAVEHIIKSTVIEINVFENNHRKINTLEEIEILKAASSKYLLYDVIAGQNDPIYKLLPTSVILTPRSTAQAKQQTKIQNFKN